jgi:hypothetical protein
MILIAEDVFGPAGDGSYSNETILLVGTFEVATAEAALRSAGRRFMMVDETGVEHPSYDSLEDAEEEGLYSPNYVSDPSPKAEGIEMYVDCKGEVEEPMGLAFRRILVEELEAAGLNDVSITNSTGE